MPIEETTEVEAPGLDIAEAVAGIAEDLDLSPATEETEPPEGAEQTEEQKAAAAAASGSGGSEAVATVAPPAAADPNNVPPDTWTKEMQAKWAGVAPDVQAEIRRREGDIAKYVNESRPRVEIGKRFEQVIEPFVPVFQRTGLDPWQHVSNLLQAHAAMTFGSPQEKYNAFAGLAQAAGVDLRGLATGNMDLAVNNPAMLRISQLEQTINDLRSGVTQVTSTVQAARTAELEDAVLRFGQDVEAHPFFWEVTDEVQRFLKTGAATNLDSAYQLALMANPSVKQKVLDREMEKRSAASKQTEAARAAKAAKAAGANVRSRKGGRAAPETGSIDDTLKTTMAEINARTN